MKYRRWSLWRPLTSVDDQLDVLTHPGGASEEVTKDLAGPMSSQAYKAAEPAVPS